MTPKRIFIGSFIHGNDIFQLYNEVQKILTPVIFKAKWTRQPENLHITFHFIGEMPNNEILKLKNVLQPVLETNYPVDLHLNGLKYFKRKNKPSVLYINVDDQGQVLQNIYRQIQIILFENGFIDQPRTHFKPHITLARIKRVTSDFYQAIENINVDIHYSKPVKIQIIESILQPEGAIYKELKF